MNKILIVEDDPMIAEIYQKKFSEAGYEVLTAESGEKALKVLENEDPDVMMLDLVMPEMDGFDVIEKIRSEKNNQKIKIFVFSNLSQKEDQEKAMRLGANGFVVKSAYAPSALVKEIGRMINESSQLEKNSQIKNGQKKDEKGDDKQNKKVLLIEDEKIFAEMFGEKLKQDGFDLTVAENGAWGTKEALSHDYDVFIIDMVMPAMMGEEIVSRLKMEEKTKTKPIIVLSASVDELTEKKMRQMGISEFFIKTQIVPSELSKKVEELLESP